MIKILIAVLVFSINLSSQSHFKNSTFYKKKVNSEIFTVNGDTTYKVFFLYKIPYNSLVFEKELSKFTAKYELLLEVKNSKEQIVQRSFKKDFIEVNDYNMTVSEKIFIYDLIDFELNSDSFFCNITFNDLVASRPFSVENFRIDLITTKDKPRWLLLKKLNQNENNFEIEVFGNIVPFSSTNYDLMIFLKKDFSEIDRISIKSKDSLVTNLQFERIHSIVPQIHFSPNIQKIELKLRPKLEPEPQFLQDVLLLKNVNEKLFEGNYSIELIDKNSEIKDTIPISVIWVDKPKSLNEYDFALEMIELIETNSSYKTYFSSDNEKRNKLFNYWKPKDPTPATAFNELINEFYLRVDFAQNEFMSISQKNGAKTDRGKIYILNGKPEKTERSVNSEGKVVEVWYYKNPERIYKFIDLKGDGNFKLL